MVKRQCKAKAKSTGKRCNRAPIAGGVVCQVHGGAAPQVKRKAEERLRELQDPAITALQDALASERIVSITKKGVLKEPDTPSRVKAATVVLDRTGLGPTKTTELTNPEGKPLKLYLGVDPEDV